MKKVSSIAMFADTDANRSLKDPARSATPPMTSHAIDCGVLTAFTTAAMTASAPATTTASTYASSASEPLAVANGADDRFTSDRPHHRIAPQDEVPSVV